MKDSHRALRDGTRGSHDAVDAVFGAFDLSDPASYAAFLAAHAAVLLPYEAALEAGGIERLVPDWPERQRSAAIVADLAALSHPLPAAAAVAPLTGAGAVLGAAYVLEGSRLGGRMLARQVAPALPRAYLDADQPTGGWSRLLARMDTVLYHPDRLAEAVDSARTVFASFEASGRRWLARVE